MLERLRRDNNWSQLNSYDAGFDPYVEYVGNSRTKLLVLLQDVFWEFIIQGIIAPGSNLSNPNLPWFHITDYGRKVLDSGGSYSLTIQRVTCNAFGTKSVDQIQQWKLTSLKASIASHGELISPRLLC